MSCFVRPRRQCGLYARGWLAGIPIAQQLIQSPIRIYLFVWYTKTALVELTNTTVGTIPPLRAMTLTWFGSHKYSFNWQARLWRPPTVPSWGFSFPHFRCLLVRLLHPFHPLHVIRVIVFLDAWYAWAATTWRSIPQGLQPLTQPTDQR
jgi:hypothetical protein